MSEDLDLVLGPNSCEEIVVIDTDDLVEKLKLYEVTVRREDNCMYKNNKLYVLASSESEATEKAIAVCKKDEPDEDFEVTDLERLAEVDRNSVL